MLNKELITESNYVNIIAHTCMGDTPIFNVCRMSKNEFTVNKLFYFGYYHPHVQSKQRKKSHPRG